MRLGSRLAATNEMLIQLFISWGAAAPAVIREGQLHPSKPTNPSARSIVSSVPIADIWRTPLTTAVEPSSSSSLDDGSRKRRQATALGLFSSCYNTTRGGSSRSLSGHLWATSERRSPIGL